MRNIENLILSGQWEIEPIFALQVLAKYWHDVELIESGVKVDYSEQRAALEPGIIGSNIGRPGLYSEEIPKGSIARLKLSGAMRLEDGLSSRGIGQLVADIQAADDNDNIAGILLEVNSGGGEVTAGTELKNALDDVRRNGRTKVGVYAQQMASAAVRGTLPADFILAANPSTFVGSVGTMMTVDKSFLDYARKYMVDIYAEQSSRKNEEYRALLEGDYGPIRQMLTENNQHFLDEVQQYRLLRGSSAEVGEVLSGKLFTADVALQRGLVDGIGTFGQAVERLQSISSPENGNFYNISKGAMNFKSIANFISALVPGLNSKLGLELKEDASPDEVVEAINGAKSLEEIKAEVKAEVTADQDAKLTELTARMDELTAKLETLQQENSSLKAENEELENKFTGLEAEQEAWQTERKTLEKQVADLKGKRATVAADGTSEEKNTGTPKVGMFQTAQNFMSVLQPEGDSKY